MPGHPLGHKTNFKDDSNEEDLKVEYISDHWLKLKLMCPNQTLKMPQMRTILNRRQTAYISPQNIKSGLSQ